MSFSTDLAKVVSKQITKFITLNQAQLAGQVANLDFWTTQVRHCLSVIDGYDKRFRQMCKAQRKSVGYNRGAQEWGKTLVKVPDDELLEARNALCVATHRFLVKCYRMGLITPDEFKAACLASGIEYDEAALGMDELDQDGCSDVFDEINL